MNNNFRFIDLFAGLGGFHLAAHALGGECVFASEINPTLIQNYEKNFGIRPFGDINSVISSEIPDHDLLCAGFPCQPFSKAGSQRGWKDAVRGTLFFKIAEIIEKKRPQYIILENVSNFINHDSGNTYIQVIETLKELKYETASAKLSPHNYGVPQHRERMYIVASKGGLENFKWPIPTNEKTSIQEVIEEEASDVKPIGQHILSCLELWQRFLDLIPASSELPSFPIWSMEAGATYPLTMPISELPLKELQKCKGKFGASLAGLDRDEIYKLLPSHALRSTGFPNWKISFIERNRNFFSKHKNELKNWLDEIKHLPSSFQKLEWNSKGSERSIYAHLVQMRASGVRVKRTAYAPALVSASDSQIPVVTWKKRYLSVNECARLQCMEDLLMPSSIYDAYEALGNAVNVKMVELILSNLIVRTAANRETFVSDTTHCLDSAVNA